MGQRSLFKTHGRHGYRGKSNSRGKRLLSKLGSLASAAHLEKIFHKLAAEKHGG